MSVLESASSVRVPLRPAFAWTWLASLVLLLTACSYDQCDIGSDHCAGNTIKICEYPDCAELGGCGTFWLDTDCGDSLCVQPDKGSEPFCALSTEPEPRCEGPGLRSYCEDDARVTCQQGFATSATDCSESEQVCVPLANRALCSLSREPHPSCAETGDEVVGPGCDGERLISCDSGYATLEQPCDGACVTAPQTQHSFCALSNEPDPRCATGNVDICDDDALITCTQGYASSLIPCFALGAHCETSTFGSWCAFEPEADAGADPMP